MPFDRIIGLKIIFPHNCELWFSCVLASSVVIDSGDSVLNFYFSSFLCRLLFLSRNF